MSTDRKSFDQQTNSRNQFFTEMHGDQSGEFVFGYWGLNGYVQIDRFQMTSRPPYWCPKTILKTAAMLVFSTSPVGGEPFSFSFSGDN